MIKKITLFSIGLFFAFGLWYQFSKTQTQAPASTPDKVPAQNLETLNVPENLETLNVPENFEISIFAKNLDSRQGK